MKKALFSVPVLAVALSAPVVAQTMVVQTFNGDAPGQFFGQATKGAGDVNNDGTPDFIVGSASDDTVATDAGAARVYSGHDSTVLYSFNGDNLLDRFGHAVDGAGDVNNDGYDDVVVSAPRDDTIASDAGQVIVFSGATGLPMYTWNGSAAGERFGESVAAAGDVNQDGFDDVIVGTATTSTVRIFSGQSGQVLRSYIGNFTGLGYSVACAGDIDGDTIPDLIAGALGGAGSAIIYSGVDGTEIRSYFGQYWGWGHDSIPESLGRSVAGVGDVDGDGRDDVAIGCNMADCYTGRALVFSGMDGSLIHEFWGTQVEDQYGYAVGAAGDVNGDGRADVIVSTGPNYSYIPDAARVDVLSGLDGSTLLTIHPDGEDDWISVSLDGVGDVDGDGHGDIVFGIPGDDTTVGVNSEGYCFGNAADCPCGNAGSGLGGCDIPQGTGGYELSVENHSPDFAGGGTADFIATGYPVMSLPGVTLIRSPIAQLPTAFGDGLLCMSAPVVRVSATLGMNGSSLNPVMHGAGAGTFYYQVWVRSTPIMFCDPTAAFNLSNGVALTWP
jgi:hypothetical protein